MLTRYNAVLIPARPLQTDQFTNVLCCSAVIHNFISDAYYLIGCETLEHLSIMINDKWFDLWLDECGRLNNLPETLFINQYQQSVVGNLLITKGGDSLEPLTEEDITDIQDWVRNCRLDLTNYI